jgi:hypothetical protein
MTLEYSSIGESFPELAGVAPGGVPTPPPRPNNGWYVPAGGGAASCVYVGQDAGGLQRRLEADGGDPSGSRHMGGGGMRPGNNHPSVGYVACRADGSDVVSYCLPPVERAAYAPKPSNA